MKKTFNVLSVRLFGLAVVIAAIALNAMFITGCNDEPDNSSTHTDGKYDAIYLKANSWNNENGGSGENWSSGTQIKLSDFTAVKPEQGKVLRFKISGVSDKEIKYFRMDIYQLSGDGLSTYRWLGLSDKVVLPKTFNNSIFDISIWGDYDSNAVIYIDLLSILWQKNSSGEYTDNSGETLPADTPNGTVMATIKNFSISLVKDDDNKEPGDGTGIEYTDVVYSADGSKITLYLDGNGVNIPKAQRAMSAANATMAFDYIEVIFIANGTTVREQWELGQSAGVSGITRGIDYAWSAGSTASGPVALLAVGQKSDKTLLGIGNIKEVDGAAGTKINTGTKSVTFYIEAIKTGLVATGDSPANTSDSFDFVSSGSTKPEWTRAGHSARFTLGDSSYPAYFLPGENDSIQNAKYEFFGATATFAQQIRLSNTTTPYVYIERRPPRYMDGGRYMWLKNDYIASNTTVTLGTYTSTAGSPLVPVIPLVFTSKGTGIFSFYIEIPVYILTNTNAVAWRIRTGLRSELYSLDDGRSNGGCVLMGVGITNLDSVEWEWLPY